MKQFLLTAIILTTVPSSVPAGQLIEKACLKAGRTGTSAAVCGCIQQVADMRLKRKDQRLAARFFKDPHKAQVIRQSTKSSNEQFWTRYKAWGLEAEELCQSANP
ncbi:MAG: hypothetical protein GXP05_11570 [Alphaproteobacteria bacterium]|nr:hypothetical protein [Alphaproteobacteria bacterium]